MKIDKQKFTEYCEVGVPQEVIDELEDSTEFNSPTFDETTSLEIDGVPIENINQILNFKITQEINLLNSNQEAPTKRNKKIEFALVTDRWIKYSCYTLQIYENFDLNKITIDVSKEANFGRDTYTYIFDLYYDGSIFLFKENDGANVESSYLRTSKGGAFGV